MKKFLAMMLLLAASVYAEDIAEVIDCKSYCDPMGNPYVEQDHVEWFSSDEWGWKEEYEYEHRSDVNCSSVMFCEAFCWVEYYYPPHPSTDAERAEAIASYKEMADEHLALPEGYCGKRVNKWNGVTQAYGYAGKYSNEMGAYVDAAEAYYLEGSYYEDMYAEGFEKATYADALPLAANAYRMSGKAYCSAGLDEEAHVQFESARRVYRSLGTMDEQWIGGLVDDEECGKYAEPESCSSAFILIGAAAASIFSVGRGKITT
ncbi:hypothetical protein JW721_05265 [Candidatus Micrarchaeota archaeon]|nr:hypothetical protein [Candidatus Micrarchaeota archaeon]